MWYSTLCVKNMSPPFHGTTKMFQFICRRWPFSRLLNQRRRYSGFIDGGSRKWWTHSFGRYFFANALIGNRLWRSMILNDGKVETNWCDRHEKLLCTITGECTGCKLDRCYGLFCQSNRMHLDWPKLWFFTSSQPFRGQLLNSNWIMPFYISRCSFVCCTANT